MEAATWMTYWLSRGGLWSVGLCLALQAYTLCAAEILGTVVSVSDGDTITVLDSSHTQHKIRLSGIDAPEKRQAFGQRSKQTLSDLVIQQQVTVEWSKRDRYGRVVGKVVLPSGADVNLQQIRRGMAWHYKQYEQEQTPADRVAYAGAEEAARERRVGLWQDAEPMSPWQYRRGK
jgi:endonuclease YncB( thermonuclease family)